MTVGKKLLLAILITSWAHAGMATEMQCVGGDSESCLDLAYAFGEGNDVTQDKAKAVKFYGLACEGGAALGCYHTAYSYYTGRGVDLNKSVALRYFAKACDLNSSRGCVTAGITCDDLSDKKNALKYYQIACSMDDAQCNNLGLAYKSGEGVKQNKEKALKLFLRACDSNTTSGCYNAGVLFEQKKEIKKAIALHTKACQGGRMQSCYRLGVVLENSGKPQEAQRVYEKSCKGDIVDGCLKAAYYYTKKEHLDKVKIIALEKKACELDSPYGCYVLGLAYREGYGVTKDSKQALTWLNQACRNKLDIGCFEMSISFIDDRFGIKTDLKRANEYMRKACTLGNKKACRLRLNILKDLKKECEHGDFSVCDYIATLGYKEIDTTCDAGKMISFLSKECEENDFKQCHKLGHFYTYKDAEKELCKETLVRTIKGLSADRAKKYIPFLEKACGGAIYRACSELGLLYALQKELKHSFSYFQKACEGGDGRGCLGMGNQYMEGNGVSKDHKKALALFKKSCEMGNKLGCRYHERLLRK